MFARRLPLVAVLSAPFLACGDDGGGSETESDGSSGTGSGGTSVDPTNASTMPSTMDDGGSTGAGSADGSGGTSTGGSGDAADTSGSGEGEGSGSGSGTGSAGACAEVGDAETCDAEDGCAWIGNANNGVCAPMGPDACAALMSQQLCNMHPDCSWDNQGATCTAA